MKGKQQYYQHLERQKAAEDAFATPEPQGYGSIEDVYIDVGLRAFAAFQNCLDWVGNLQRDHPRPQPAAMQSGPVAGAELTNLLNEINEQLERLHGAVSNLEAGMRRIDKYTLDAFRQLSELEQAGLSKQAEQTPHRRLAKEDARSIAIKAAKQMLAEGFPLSLASVAREAGLKYGQIVYAFGNKENFLSHLQELEAAEPDSDVDTDAAPADAMA